MQGIELDLTEIAAIWMGGTLLLVPLLGMVARFALTPLLDALARLRAGSDHAAVAELRRQLERQERRVAELGRQVERVAAVDRQF